MDVGVRVERSVAGTPAPSLDQLEPKSERGFQGELESARSRSMAIVGTTSGTPGCSLLGGVLGMPPCLSALRFTKDRWPPPYSDGLLAKWELLLRLMLEEPCGVRRSDGSLLEWRMPGAAAAPPCPPLPLPLPLLGDGAAAASTVAGRVVAHWSW